MNFIKKITGSKCYLSPVDDRLAEIVASWSNDIDISLNTGDITDMITVETQKQYLKGMTSASGYGFYIVDNKTNEAVGIARIMRINHINRIGVLGIFIGNEKNRSKGVGFEASKLLLDYGFNILNLRNIMAEVFSFNKASLRMCEKVGFKQIGARRAALRYGEYEFDEIFLDILDDEFDSPYIKEVIAKL